MLTAFYYQNFVNADFFVKSGLHLLLNKLTLPYKRLYK